jgi:hypothetical protein
MKADGIAPCIQSIGPSHARSASERVLVVDVAGPDTDNEARSLKANRAYRMPRHRHADLPHANTDDPLLSNQ